MLGNGTLRDARGKVSCSLQIPPLVDSSLRGYHYGVDRYQVHFRFLIQCQPALRQPLRCSKLCIILNLLEKLQLFLSKSIRIVDNQDWDSLIFVLVFDDSLFFQAVVKYKHEYERIPVLIIDNANRLAEKQLELLEQIQDYAKLAADQGTATVVFVSSEGRVPRRMMATFQNFIERWCCSTIY